MLIGKEIQVSRNMHIALQMPMLTKIKGWDNETPHHNKQTSVHT